MNKLFLGLLQVGVLAACGKSGGDAAPTKAAPMVVEKAAAAPAATPPAPSAGSAAAPSNAAPELRDEIHTSSGELPAAGIASANAYAAAIKGDDAAALAGLLAPEVNLFGKKLAKDTALAKLKADGLRKTMKIVDPTPHGGTWNFEVAAEANQFEISDAPYGKVRVARFGLVNGQWLITAFATADYGAP